MPSEKATQAVITELETPNGVLRIHGDGCIVGKLQQLSITYRNMLAVVSLPALPTNKQIRAWLLDVASSIDANIAQTEVDELLQSLEGTEL